MQRIRNGRTALRRRVAVLTAVFAALTAVGAFIRIPLGISTITLQFLFTALAGVLLGLTDFAYWLYVTDLGLDRDYERQGIATRLMKTAHELAGGEKDIAVYLIANEEAVPFYEKLGMKQADDVMKYNHIEWTEWTV